mmetsp:Transcript_19440/g.27357  ORF Transcript_19440/g.27357 Transcript_19440/m.27357 type:complete len:80 (-) Transcript_19440:570-809(-)
MIKIMNKNYNPSFQFWFYFALFLVALRWIAFGEGNLPISIRRWLSMKRVELRKKLGYRDETKYKMSAGDGANQKYKRQG